MNYRLRMDHDFHVLIVHIEQEVRFDHLERFVDERRRIDGDLLAHRPGGMLQRFGDGRARYTLRLPSAEGATGGGEDQPRQFGRPAAGHALQHRAVLGVDGYDFAATLPRRRGDQLTGHHQRFLIRERDAFPRPQRRQCRLEPGRADDAVHDDLDIGTCCCLDETIRASPRTITNLSLLPSPPIHKAYICRLPLRSLLGQQFHVGVAGDGDHPKPLALSGQHLEGRAADRSG